MNASLSLRVINGFHVSAESMLGVTANRLGVTDRYAKWEDWGQPFATLAFRMSWVLE
jgi:hypothetical protein